MGHDSSTFKHVQSSRRFSYARWTVVAAMTSCLWHACTYAGPAMLIRDLNAGPAGSNPRMFIALDDRLLFAATTAAEGEELWRTDGSESGTSLVSDIYAGANSSVPSYPWRFGTDIYFRATTPTHGAELWKSNGTPTGTSMVYDVRIGTGSSNPAYICDVGGVVIFSAFSTTSVGTELYYHLPPVSNDILRDIHNVAGQSSSPADLVRIGDTVYFSAASGGAGRELWKTEGTGPTTVMVANINPTPNYSSNPVNLTPFGERLLFVADDGTNGQELWLSDGTSTGTVLVKDINVGASTSPQYLTVVGQRAFFTATDGTHGRELWVTDGTSSGTALVKDLWPGGDSAPSSLVDVNGILFFAASDGVNGTELWKSDGTEEGTVLVKNLAPGAAGSMPSNLTNIGGTLVFTASDGTHGSQVWRSDGTSSGTMMLDKIGSGDASPGNYTLWNGKVVFAATGDEGRELWRLASADVTPPRIESIIRNGSAATAQANVEFTITFSEDVTGVGVDDFQIDAAGLTGCAVQAVSGSGAVRIVTVSTGAGEGSLSIDATDDDSITDAGGNYLGGYGAGNGGFSGGEAYVVDRVPPSVTVGPPSVSMTKSGPVSYPVTYGGATSITLSEEDVKLVATGSARGTLTVLNTGATTRTIRVSGISGDGTLGIAIASGTAVDGAGNLAPAPPSPPNFSVDNTGPSVSIGPPSAALTRSGPVSYTVTYTGADAITINSNHVQVHSTGTAGATASISGFTATTATVTLTSITGDGTLAIALVAGTATDFLGNDAPATGLSPSFEVDNTGPTATISLLDPVITNLDSVRFGVSFNEPVGSTFGLTAITLTGSLAGTASRTITGTGPHYTVTVTPASPDADGTIGLTVRNTVRDMAGNAYAGGSAPNEYVIDNTPPTGIVTRTQSSPTNLDVVGYDIEFSESVGTTFSLSDVQVTGSLTAGAGTILSGSAASYHLALTPFDPNANGTIGMLVAGEVTDVAGNPLIPMASPASYDIDNAAPTVSIGAPSAASTVTGPVSYTLTYAGATSIALDVSKLTLHRTGTANGTLSVSGSGLETRTVTIAGISGSGTLAISVLAGTALDDAGNVASAVGPSEVIDVESLELKVLVSAPSVALTRTGPVTYQVQYLHAATTSLTNGHVSLAVTGTANADVAVTLSGIDTYTVTLSNITGDGTLGIAVASGSATDLEHQPAHAFASTDVVAVDNTPPVITLLGRPSMKVQTGSAYSDAGATALDSLAGNLTASIVTVSNVDTSTPGLYVVEYAVSDPAGNAATKVTRRVEVSDDAPPSVPVNPWLVVLGLGLAGAWVARRRGHSNSGGAKSRLV